MSKGVKAQAQVMRRLASWFTAWLVGPHASLAYASHAYAQAARGGRHGLSGAGFHRLPRWATAPDLD